MGLENHVDNVIKRDAPELWGTYQWYQGMEILWPEAAELLADVLNKSGEFGPAKVVGSKIEFGIHPSFLKSAERKKDEH